MGCLCLKAALIRFIVILHWKGRRGNVLGVRSSMVIWWRMIHRNSKSWKRNSQRERKGGFHLRYVYFEVLPWHEAIRNRSPQHYRLDLLIRDLSVYRLLSTHGDDWGHSWIKNRARRARNKDGVLREHELPMGRKGHGAHTGNDRAGQQVSISPQYSH